MKAVIIGSSVVAYVTNAFIQNGVVNCGAFSYGGMDLATVKIIDATAPADFQPGRYVWNGSAIVRSTDYMAELTMQAKSDAMAGLAARANVALTTDVTLTAFGNMTNSFAPQWLGLITGAYLAAQADPTLVVQWQGQNGFRQLTSAQVIALYRIGATYVQGCFAAQAGHLAALDALTTLAELEAYDYSTGWPATTI